MNIVGRIEGIRYELKLPINLEEVDIEEFDVNSMPSSCLVKIGKSNIALSKWVSPKRTRSYPFERVYNTLHYPKKYTVIPILKDEGSNGDRDFIQWDTISLMSLLDVYVVFAYYTDADINPRKDNKITNQKFDNKYVTDKILEINNYHSSALHWNLKEIKENLSSLIDMVKNNYSIISNKLNVKFHSDVGIDLFKAKINMGHDEFMKMSRIKAKQAQMREHVTTQPKEFLHTETKATITIENYLGGKYFLTTDEVKLEKNIIYLIEGKHTQRGKLPSIGDVKDGLLKMILYCNLIDVSVNGVLLDVKPILSLTSSNLIGKVTSSSSKSELYDFFRINMLNSNQISLINNLLTESRVNNFKVEILGV